MYLGNAVSKQTETKTNKQKQNNCKTPGISDSVEKFKFITNCMELYT